MLKINFHRRGLVHLQLRLFFAFQSSLILILQHFLNKKVGLVALRNQERPMEEKSKGSERWMAAIANLSEMSSNLDSLQNLIVKKAVYVDEATYSKAHLASEQARTIKVLEQRVETLERELDSAISTAAHARTEKRQAEVAQKAAELRAQEITKELENTTKVFKLHMEELRAKQEEIAKRDSEIKLLEAIIQTLGGKS